MAEMTPKKNLVITRAGDYSQHESWLEGTSYEARDWDLLVSCFGQNPEKWKRDDVIHHFHIGGKDGFFEAFKQMPHLLDAYEYIMIIDDDFFTSAEDINKVFSHMREYDLQIGQPALSHESFFCYYSLFQNPQFKLRWVNFVQDGFMCLSNDVWRKILPLHEKNPMAMFIDTFLHQLTDDPKTKMAIFDDISFTHGRPIGGSLWEAYFHSQKDSTIRYTVPNHQIDLDNWGLTKIVSHAGILKNGKRIKGRWRLLPHLILGWIKTARKIEICQAAAPKSQKRYIKKSIANQITGKGVMQKTHIIIHGKAN